MNVRTALVAVLSVLGPALVFGGAYAGLRSWSDADDVQAERNAGRVVNGRVIGTDTAAAMDRLLAARTPRVVILGPSYANTDIRTDLLAARLGVPRDEIALLSVPNTVGAHWYAILKYRLFEAGHRPELVIVVSGLQSMLLTTPLTESSFVNLEVHLPEDGDPLVASKVKQTGSLVLARLREQRGKVREWVFDLVRDLPVVLLTPATRLQARMALDRVFDDSRVDMALHGSSIPVEAAQRELDRYYTPDMLPAPDDSFVPDTTALVTAAGARIVWVRPPMSPDIPAHLDDVVLPGAQERAIALVEERGGAFVDMRALPMSTAMFKNEDHMNEEGSRRFSEALAKALVELDALHPRVDPGALGALAVTERILGPAAPGDGLRVAPGGRHVFTVAEWPRGRGAFELAVLAEHAGDRDAPPVTVEVAGAGVPLARAPASGGRTRWSGSLAPAAPSGPFDVSVAVAADGVPVRVVALALGRRLGRTFLAGDAAALEGRQVRLFGVTRVVDGVLVDDSVHPEYAAKPVKPPGGERVVTDLPDEVAAYDTERWAFLSDESLMGETAFGSRCSPLRIAEDDAVLPYPNVPCNDVKRKGHGRSCHTLDHIFFTASDGSDPARNGRTYRLVLDEGRRCDGAKWLYPVDRMEVAFPAARVAELRDGAGWLVLEARYLNYREAPLKVRLTAAGRTLVDAGIDGRDLKKGPAVWKLDPPLPPDAGDVVLELESGAHVFYLFTGATLAERPPS